MPFFSDSQWDAALELGRKLEPSVPGYPHYRTTGEDEGEGWTSFGLTIDQLFDRCFNDMDPLDESESSIPAFATFLKEKGVKELFVFALLTPNSIRISEINFEFPADWTEKDTDHLMELAPFQLEGEAPGCKWADRNSRLRRNQ